MAFIVSFVVVFLISNRFVLAEDTKDMNKLTISDEAREAILYQQQEAFDKIKEEVSNKNLKPVIRVIKDKKEIYNYAIKSNIPNPDTILDIKIIDFIEDNKVKNDYFDSLQSEFVDPNDIYIKRTGSSTFTDYNHITRESIFVGPGSYTMTASDTIECKVSCSYTINLELLSAAFGFDVKQSRTISDNYSTSAAKGEKIKVTAYARYQKYDFEVWEKDVFYDDFLGKGNIKRFCGIEFVQRVVAR